MGSQPYVYTGLPIIMIIMIILPLEFTVVGHAYVSYQLIVTNQEGPYLTWALHVGFSSGDVISAVSKAYITGSPQKQGFLQKSTTCRIII